VARVVDDFTLDRLLRLRLPSSANQLTRMMGWPCRPVGRSAPQWRMLDSRQSRIEAAASAASATVAPATADRGA